MRKPVVFILVAAVVLTALLFMEFGTRALGELTFYREMGLPPIARGLPFPADQTASQSFHDRVVDQFGQGMTDGNMMNTLRAEGWEVTTLSPTKRMTAIGRAGWKCTASWIIYWDADETGKAVDVRGEYVGKCG